LVKPAEPDEFRLHDGVTTALVSAAHHQPLAVVLEDLHWADAASVRLLDFVARHTWFERILLLGTYRDLEPVWHEHPVHAVADTLLGKATTITLTGLGRDEVGTLMARHTGHEPTSDLVSEVHRRTGGNPWPPVTRSPRSHPVSPTSCTNGWRDCQQRSNVYWRPPPWPDTSSIVM